MIKTTALALLASALVAGSAAAQPAPSPAYTVTQTVPLGGPDRWDYVVFDASSGRVYVAHSDRLDVVDGTSGRLVGKVPLGAGGAHGVAISPDTGKGYTDDGQAGVAVAFDLKSLQPLKRIPAQPDADAVVVDPSSGHVFVVDGDSKTLTVIDPKTDAVLATVDAGGGVEYAVAPGDGKLYVNGAERRELLRMDTRTNQIDARWPLPDCQSPHGLAFDRAGRRAFVSCVNRQMMVVNADTGAVVAHLPIGRGTDAAAFDPNRKLAFSSNGEGTISVIREVDPQTFLPAGEIRTQATARTMDIDPRTGRLFVAAAQVDASAPQGPSVNGHPGRPTLIPGSLQLLVLDPVQ